MAVAITEQENERTENRPPFWHRSAPRRLVEKFGSDVSKGWTTWQKHVASRKRPSTPPFLSGEEPPLWWGTDGITACEARDADWANQDASAWAALTAAYSLPEMTKSLPAESWWELAERLRSLASDAEQLRVDLDSDPRDVLRQQLLAGELPLALAYLFPEVQFLRALREPARVALSEAIVEFTDGEGLPHGRLLPVLGPLWACWTRVRWMGQRLKRGCWSREAEIQYQWLVRHAIRLTDVGGRFMLSEPHELSLPKTSWPQGLYTMALELVGDRGDCAAAAAMLPRRVVPRGVKIANRDLPEASLASEWSEVALLATDWTRSSARLALSFVDEPMKIELAAGREPLLAGAWTSRTTCDGETVRACGEWEQVCWQSDSKSDYLELGLELSHGLRLERQLLLAHEDRVLYLADIVIAADGARRRLAHTVELPLGPAVRWQPEAETRDGLVVGRKERAAVLPLALTEWRSDPRRGRLDEIDGKLALSQQTTGRALCCPLLVDLDRRRTKKERTWRELTVAEALEIVPRDMAVGFRAQAGRDQWLFYRSLAPAGNRTVLGQNIAGEFCAGRFLKSGKLDEWIEIEAC
jgi:hypothetical protein